MTPSKMSEPKIIMEAKNISKQYPGTLALNDVDFNVYEGRIHALAGENGAGKSTLIKVLGGVVRPSSGQIKYNNELVKFDSPKEAIDNKIVTIHQEFSLVPSLSAEENIFLGQYPTTNFGRIDRKFLREKSTDLLKRLDIDIDPSVPVSELSIAQQQMVEIAKALSRDVEILILDEPTAVLGRENVEKLISLLLKLRDEGLGLIYISHRLEEVFKLGDFVTVLRDGEVSGKANVSEVNKDWLIKKMIGREQIINKKTVKKEFGPVALKVKNMFKQGYYENISFEVKKGEIVTLAGLVGAGRTEVAKSIFGSFSFDRGEIELFGERVKINNTTDAMKKGVVYLPEDRKEEGLLLIRSVKENISISSLRKFYEFPMIREAKEIQAVEELIDSLNIKTASLDSLVRSLSGGNQQKVVIARLLSRDCKILILDEPTRGVDIGAKEEIYELIKELSKEGLAILLITSEMDEVIKLSDRVVVLRKGKISTKLTREDISEEAIMNAALIDEEE